MTKAPGIEEVNDLAVAGMRAGFTVEQMLRLLNLGISCELLSEIIEKSLAKEHVVLHQATRS